MIGELSKGWERSWLGMTQTKGKGRDSQSISARLDSLVSQRGLQCCDMSRFVLRYLNKATANPWRVPGVREGGVVVFVQSLGVKGTFKIFEG